MVLFSQSGEGDGPFSQLIIRGVTLINGNGAPPQGPIDIVVENNIIKNIQVVGYPGVKIDSSKRPQLKPGGKELDCVGMYILPGFIDMHTHIGGVAQGAEPDYVFKLWLAHGVTTVREVGGRSIDWSLDLKDKSAKNEIIAPRIFTYTSFGQKNENFNPLNDIPISTSNQARAWVQANAKRGADGIKFFGAEPEIIAAALDENKKLGLGSAFHHAQLNVAQWNVLHSARAGLTVFRKLYLIMQRYKTFHWTIIIKMNNIVLKVQGNYGHRLQNHIPSIGIRSWTNCWH